MKAVADILTSLLYCEFDKVPTEVLIHRFMFLFKSQQHRLSPYVTCLDRRNLTIPNCRHHIESTCPERFGQDMETEEFCRRQLWDKRANPQTPFIERDVTKRTSFDKYQTCMNRQRQVLEQHCLPSLQDVCDNARIRTTKTVRLNMATAMLLLRQVRNLRVIHLIRDPRAVVLSRTSQATYHGHYSGKELHKEALLYCRGVTRDVLVRHELLDAFPGSLYELNYEDFTHQPQRHVQEIYRFLDETIPASVENWLAKNTGGEVKNSTAIAEKWKDKMKYIDVIKINEVCQNMYAALNNKYS